MPPTNGAFAKLVTTNTSATSIVAGGATGAATSGTGGFTGGTLKLSAGIAIDGGTLTDHGIVMPSAVPAVTTAALYNNGGTLTWNGTAIPTGAIVSGTTGTIAKFTSSTAVGNSIITESGAAISVAGTVTATTFIGNVTGNLTGSVLTAAQTAITSVGTLTALTVSGPRRITGAISPTQLVANTDNWNPTGLSTCNVIRIDVDAPRNITGIVAQADGTLIALYNLTAHVITLVHDATSTAANRFYCPTSADFPLTATGSVWIRYDGTSQRWTVFI